MYARLPESVQTLYAELLDQTIRAEAQAIIGLQRGSFVSKKIKGRTYWYLQRVEGNRKRQTYLGPESPPLLSWMQSITEKRRENAADEKRRRELVSMLLAGGAAGEKAATVQVLRTLADSGIFRMGGVLVGTQALPCLANVLGVRFEQQVLQTADVDLAQDPAISVALAEERAPVDVLKQLQQAEPNFFAVPSLDPRQPSTSFKVRGRDLRVDFLTPAPRRGGDKPVFLPLLKVAATPMRLLDYLIEETLQGVILGGNGVLVNVPDAARFAFHKLWTSRERPAAEQTKARKDLRQAASLIEVLLDDRPGDLQKAWAALQPRKSATRVVRSTINRLDPSLATRLFAALAAR